MIQLIDNKVYDVCGAYKREITGYGTSSSGLCYLREKDCKLLVSSVDITSSAKAELDKLYKY